jgi:hypothetical protein
VGTTKSVGCSPLCAHRRMLEGVGRRVDPRAAWNALHVEETEMKMPGFHHLRERISHLTHHACTSWRQLWHFTYDASTTSPLP